MEMGQCHVKIRPSTGWAAIRIAELWEYRDVFFMLAKRDISLRYKQTALGVFWVLLQPLVSGLIFAVVFGHFAKLPNGSKPYFLSVFAGLLIWNLFAGVLQRAGNSLVAESRLISKVYFPRLLIPCSCAAAAVVDFTISLVMMALLLWFYNTPPHCQILTLPFVLLTTLGLAVGASFWISALNIRYRDFMYALPFVLQTWMYASPVVYDIELVPMEWRTLFQLNPLCGVIDGMRYALLGANIFPLYSMTVAAIASFAVFISGAFFFRRVEREFADLV